MRDILWGNSKLAMRLWLVAFALFGGSPLAAMLHKALFAGSGNDVMMIIALALPFAGLLVGSAASAIKEEQNGTKL